MAAEKKELNHAECIDRELKEWKKIFSLTEKAYGYRINAYKGDQKLVYIPDVIDGKKVAFIHNDAFPLDCAIICNKRLWEKMDYNQDVSAVSYLKYPEKYPDDFAQNIKRYILQNKDSVLKQLILEDNTAAFERFLHLLGKKTDLRKLIENLFAIDNIPQIKAYLLGLGAESERAAIDDKRVFDLDKDPYSVGEIKKNWLYKKADDGTIILTGYKGTETKVIVPDRVGNIPVTQLGELALSAARKRSTPEQQRSVNSIQSIVIPEGIKVLGAELCKWNMNFTEIFLPATVVEIGEDAFSTYRGPKSVTVHAPAGSFAEKFAIDNNMPFIAFT